MTLPPSHWADQFNGFLDALDEISPPDPESDWRNAVYCVKRKQPDGSKTLVRFTRSWWCVRCLIPERDPREQRGGARDKYEHVIGDEEKWYPIPLERQKPNPNNPMDMVETFNELMPLERICPSAGKILLPHCDDLALSYQAENIQDWQWKYINEWRGVDKWKDGEQAPHVNHLFPDVCFHGRVSTKYHDYFHFYGYEHYVDRSVTPYQSKVVRFYYPEMPEVEVRVGEGWMSLLDQWWYRYCESIGKLGRFNTLKRPKNAPFYIKDGNKIYVASSNPCTWRYKSDAPSKADWCDFPLPSARYWHDMCSVMRKYRKPRLLIEFQKIHGRVGIWDFWFGIHYPYRFREGCESNIVFWVAGEEKHCQDIDHWNYWAWKDDKELRREENQRRRKSNTEQGTDLSILKYPTEPKPVKRELKFLTNLDDEKQLKEIGAITHRWERGKWRFIQNQDEVEDPMTRALQKQCKIETQGIDGLSFDFKLNMWSKELSDMRPVSSDAKYDDNQFDGMADFYEMPNDMFDLNKVDEVIVFTHYDIDFRWCKTAQDKYAYLEWLQRKGFLDHHAIKCSWVYHNGKKWCREERTKNDSENHAAVTEYCNATTARGRRYTHDAPAAPRTGPLLNYRGAFERRSQGWGKSAIPIDYDGGEYGYTRSQKWVNTDGVVIRRRTSSL